MNDLLVTAAGYDLYKIFVPDEIEIWCKKATWPSSQFVETFISLYLHSDEDCVVVFVFSDNDITDINIFYWKICLFCGILG